MKYFIILLYFSLSLYSQTPKYHFRIIVNKSFYQNEKLVFDFNNVSIGNAPRVVVYNTIGQFQYVGVNVYSDSFQTVASNYTYHTRLTSDFTYYQVNNTNYNNPAYGNNIDIYMRYDTIGNRQWSEHDRIFEPIKFIDKNGNGLVNFEDLYKSSADAFSYPSQTLYFYDENGDGNADSGELFNDNNGTSGRTQSAENIPIRANLDDTDGDGTDEDEDEEDTEDEEEINLDDKLPGLDQFKNIIGIDSITIPSSTDMSFTINFGLGTYHFDGVASIPYVNTMRVAFRDLLVLFFTWLFIKQLITTFRQW
jgi:hypothetical protein